MNLFSETTTVFSQLFSNIYLYLFHNLFMHCLYILIILTYSFSAFVHDICRLVSYHFYAINIWRMEELNVRSALKKIKQTIVVWAWNLSYWWIFCLNKDNKWTYLSVLRAEKPGTATDNSLTGMEALEGFVMGLYLEAFQALVSLINRWGLWAVLSWEVFIPVV